MNLGYQKNGSPETSTWKTDVDNFQGYVRAKLENLDESQAEQWKAHISMNNKISDLEKKAQYQLGGIGVLYIIITLFLAACSAGIIHIGGI